MWRITGQTIQALVAERVAALPPANRECIMSVLLFSRTTALAAAIGLVATTATAPSLNTSIISETAQAVLDGVILGSSAWPSVPIDARGGLQLFSNACEEEGRCKRVSVGSIDD
jgi:hypothetical protein